MWNVQETVLYLSKEKKALLKKETLTLYQYLVGIKRGTVEVVTLFSSCQLPPFQGILLPHPLSEEAQLLLPKLQPYSQQVPGLVSWATLRSMHPLTLLSNKTREFQAL